MTMVKENVHYCIKSFYKYIFYNKFTKTYGTNTGKIGQLEKSKTFSWLKKRIGSVHDVWSMTIGGLGCELLKTFGSNMLVSFLLHVV